MNIPLHVALIAASAAHRKRSFGEFARLGLTEGQPKVLAHLLGEEGLSQKELACRCGVEPATMTALLRRMGERGLIRKEQVRLPGGKRAFQVYLTPRGREAGQQAMEVIRRLEEESFRGFSREEREQLLSLLERVTGNLGEV